MGSGKSAVAEILRRLGYAVLDADKIVHQLLGPGGPAEAKILRTFGEKLRGPDGHLDRRALGRAVFGNPARLEKLEGILHPMVRQEVANLRKNLFAQGRRVIFYDVPLLFEKKMQDQFDHVIVVIAPDEIRRQRLKARSGMTDAEFNERSKHHIPPAEKEARASEVIYNFGDLDDLKAEVKDALKALRIPPPITSPD